MATKTKSLSYKKHSRPGILAAALFLFLGQAALPAAQKKPPAGFADFGKWQTLVSVGRDGGLSPDGRWLTYGINRSNRENELRITKIADGTTTTVAFGSRPVFSADSKWVAYRIGCSEAEQEKLRAQKKPVRNNLGLLDLEKGEISTLEGVESFVFSADGAWLGIQMARPEPSQGSEGSAASSGRGGSDPKEEPIGATLIIRDLASGRDMTFGNVSHFAWQDKENSHLLAMTISAAGKTGNGVHLFDPEKSRLRVLDSSSSIYTGLKWRKHESDLAVFRAETEKGKEDSTHDILCWPDPGTTEQKRVYAPSADASFPKGKRIVPFRDLTWSMDGKTLFLGITEWKDKISPPEKKQKEEDPVPADTPATVEIWHWTDVYVMPWQKVHADQDRKRSLPAAWHIDSGRLVPLGKDEIYERVTPIRHTRLALMAEWSKYAMERSIGRPAADIYLKDTTTGERTLIKETINDRYLQAGPGGRYLLYLEDGHFWTIDLATRAVANITKTAPVSFINKESDSTQKMYPDRLQKPPFGVAGWTKDDAEVLLYDKYDIWKLACDGSGAQRLTDGAARQVRHRLVRLDLADSGRMFRGRYYSRPGEDKGIDLDKPIYMSLFGEWTKKSGYARRDPGGEVTRLIWLDSHVGSLARAKGADVYAYILQDYDDSPDIFIGGADLRDAKQVTKTNPFQADYAWGRSELIEYVTDKGRRLQGGLFYPAGYDAGKKYPMIVYNYELLSQNVHRYVVPSDRSYYNISVFTSLGYLVLEPDIVFRPRQPGWSVVECITAGVKKVVEMGIVDPARVGIVGHSMGGFNTSFAATHTDGIFAAAVAGAPITNQVSYYGDHHWGSGIAETDHIETGQERMEVALYEDLQAYIDNSAVYNVHNMTVPLLLEAGDKDGIIAWYQSIELYNIARRAKKNVVMLGYLGEDHGLRKKENQRDYQRRILAWFGHYLKGEPAEAWITEGKSFLEREEELKQLKNKK